MTRVMMLVLVTAAITGCAAGDRAPAPKKAPEHNATPAQPPEPALGRIDLDDDADRDPRSAKPGSVPSSDENSITIDVTGGD